MHEPQKDPMDRKLSLTAAVVHCVCQRRGRGHCWCHWSCKHRGFKDPLQGTIQVKSRLASHASSIHPESHLTLEKGVQLTSQTGKILIPLPGTTSCLTDLISSSGYLRTGQKPPPSHPRKLHMEEKKVPGFLQCKILLRNLHPNSQSSFECT